MDLKEVFGSARAEHEPDRPTPAACPILIVEDDPVFGQLLFPMLGVRDYASAASGVAEALSQICLLKEQPSRLVLQDLLIPEAGALDCLRAIRGALADTPGLTGLTVGRAIKDHDPDAFVVLLTGWDEQVDANESAAAGVDRIIVKPVSREQFFEMFETDDPRVREFALEASCPRS
jgi:CheY-like chemotaxis protein